MIVTEAPSPNFNARDAGKAPVHLILHYTDTQQTFDALKILQSVERKVSSHYLVGDDGSVLRLVPEEMRAWHAGKSYWEGETDINSTSIGIEIQNPGHTFGYVAFPDVQIRAVIDLCRDIIMRHRILPYHVLAHSDIAPERKKDPGELFPWALLASQHVGLWPNPNEDDETTRADATNEPLIRDLLTRYGYDPRIPFEPLLLAFQRHFEPEAFVERTEGVASQRTVSRIKALIRQRLSLRPKQENHGARKNK